MRESALTHGSLFSGIGGFDLGFERAGIETVWQVEIEDYARRVLERHFPRAQRFCDIRQCGKHNLEPVDIVSGGFPCQDISNAGKRAGIDGERSGLWSEYARIILELRPRFVVVENVAALLGRGMERVLGDLAAIGYDAEWQSIRASDVGAPHRRERIWIVAYPGRFSSESWRGVGDMGSTPPSGTSETSQRQRIWNTADDSSSNVANASVHGLSVAECETVFGTRRWEEGRAIAECDWWAVEPNVGRVAHGVPKRVDRLKGLGNAIVPQIAESIGKRIMEFHGA